MSQVKQIERLMKDVDDERVLRYAAEKRTLMTLQELKDIIRRSNTITFAKRMKQATNEELTRELLEGINEFIRDKT